MSESKCIFIWKMHFDSDIKIELIFLYLILKCINGKINFYLLKKESKYYGLF